MLELVQLMTRQVYQMAPLHSPSDSEKARQRKHLRQKSQEEAIRNHTGRGADFQLLRDYLAEGWCDGQDHPNRQRDSSRYPAC
jgi:hypothetical protein